MAKILYISYDGMTDPLGQSQVLPYLCGLADYGHEFLLLSCEKPENFSLEEESVKKIIQGRRIQWVPVVYAKNPPVLSTLWNIWKLRSKAVQLCRHEGFVIAHCRSYIASLIGLYLKKKYGVKFIFDMRGFWADERVEGGLWNLKNPLYRLIYNYFKKKEHEFLREADHIVSLTTRAKVEMEGREGLRDRNISISIIPCCVDLDLFSPERVVGEESDRYRAKLGIASGDFVLSYIGSIGTWYMLDEMLQFFKRLLAVRANSRFIFLTGEDPHVILKKARALGIPVDRIVVFKAQRNEVPALLSLSALSIFFIRPSYSKIASSPTKLGEIMGMGIPIVCNADIGDVEIVLRDNPAALTLTGFSEGQFDNAIGKIDGLLAAPKEYAIQRARDAFSLHMGVDKYTEIYKALV